MKSHVRSRRGGRGRSFVPGSVMRNDRKNNDLVLLGSVGPQNSMCLWRSILNVRSPNLNPKSLFTPNERMRIKPWMFGVSREKAKRLLQLLLQTRFRGVIHDGLNLRFRFRCNRQLERHLLFDPLFGHWFRLSLLQLGNRSFQAC